MVWFILFIFCVLAPEGMNSIVFGGEKGERSEVYCLLGKYFCQGFYLSALTLYFLWSILFIFCVLAPEEMNAIVFGRDRGRGQKPTT